MFSEVFVRLPTGGVSSSTSCPGFARAVPGGEGGVGTLTKWPYTPPFPFLQLGLVWLDKRRGAWSVLPRNVSVRLRCIYVNANQKRKEQSKTNIHLFCFRIWHMEVVICVCTLVKFKLPACSKIYSIDQVQDSITSYSALRQEILHGG